MKQEEWDDLNRRLHSCDNLDAAVAAAQQLHRTATREDLPRLMEMLNDEDFFVREAAAWPLSELAGSSALEKLLVAYQRGLDQGHDNDGLTAALIDLVESSKEDSREILQRLAESDERESAKMRCGYCNFASADGRFDRSLTR